MSTENENPAEIVDGVTDAGEAVENIEQSTPDADTAAADAAEQTIAQTTASFELPDNMPSFEDAPSSLSPEESAEKIAAQQVSTPTTGEILPVTAASDSSPDDDVESTSIRRRSLFSNEQDATQPTPDLTAPTEVEPAATAPAQAADATEAASTPTSQSTQPTWSALADAPASPEQERNLDDVLLAGSTVVGKPRSRAGAHWLGVLIALVFFPLAWLLVHEGAGFLTRGDATVWPEQVSIRGAIEFAAGAILFAAALLTARRSSVGMFLAGIVTLLIGIPFVAIPQVVSAHVGSFFDRLQAHSTLGADLVNYLMADGLSGRFALLGLLLLMVGFVSHCARRAGRREQEIVDRVRRV